MLVTEWPVAFASAIAVSVSALREFAAVVAVSTRLVASMSRVSRSFVMVWGVLSECLDGVELEELCA